MTKNEQRQLDYMSGWIVGYMAHGGSLTDDGLVEKAEAAWERRLNPPPLPEAVEVQIQDAVRVAKEAAA